MACPVKMCTVAYTDQNTFYKVPEKTWPYSSGRAVAYGVRGLVVSAFMVKYLIFTASFTNVRMRPVH